MLRIPRVVIRITDLDERAVGRAKAGGIVRRQPPLRLRSWHPQTIVLKCQALRMCALRMG